MRLLSLRRSHLLRVFMVLVALLGASSLLVATAPRALACPVCVGPDKMTLSGDGITGTATVTDPGLLAWFSASQFMGFEQRSAIATPSHTGLGVELTRYYSNSGVPASFWTQGFDHMRYYPSASGQPGYIHYEGPVSKEANTYGQDFSFWQRAGKWYALTSGEQDEMNLLLAAANGNPRTSSASLPPPASPVPPGDTGLSALAHALAGIPLAVLILLVCLALLCAGVGYRVLSTRRHPHVFLPVAETRELDDPVGV